MVPEYRQSFFRIGNYMRDQKREKKRLLQKCDRRDRDGSVRFIGNNTGRSLIM